MNELVSIIIPVYNMGHLLERSLLSILSQDYPNYEVILVDDGSTDNSFEICNKIAKEDDRVRCFHTENNGSGPARNYGILMSRGEYVYFPDADDYIESSTISTCVKAMSSGKYDLVVFGFHISDGVGRVLKTKRYQSTCLDASKLRRDYSACMEYTATLGIQGAPWNKLFKSSIIKDHKIEYPSIRRHQDEGFISRYMCYTSSVIFIPEVLYTYYSNDVKLEWQKYPIDYVDSVIGLYNVRKETILTWNTNDIRTHNLVHQSYINNVIKALELSFSPKFHFNRQQRKEWIISSISKSCINEIPMVKLGMYQSIVYNLIRNKCYNLLYVVIKSKVKLQFFIQKIR